MLSQRGFRYRIYPTPEQAARLRQWEAALRVLWNIANEQRLEYRKRGARMPSAFDQMLELTELRAAVPWMADVPRNTSAQVLSDLDLAWRRCFSGLGRQPRWKKKDRDAVGLTENHAQAFRLTGSGVIFSKVGELRAALHRPLLGIPKRCTITREIDQWFVSILCEQLIPEPVIRHGPIVAIDRGITHLLADSDGALVPNPKRLDAALSRLARSQRTVARRQRGSRRQARARLRVAKLHRKIRRQRQHALHVLSARYAKSHGVVVMEKLNVAGMIRGNLGRQISGAGWSTFSSMLRYKLEATGGTLVEVPAQHSSQTCHVCGIVNGASRMREVFSCVSCGHRDHADLNAAKVLLSRRNGGDAGRGGFPGIKGPVKRQLRVARRGPQTPPSG